MLSLEKNKAIISHLATLLKGKVFKSTDKTDKYYSIMREFGRLTEIRKTEKNGKLGTINYIFLIANHSNQTYYQMQTVGNQQPLRNLDYK